jgi:hypothetical protein
MVLINDWGFFVLKLMANNVARSVKTLRGTGKG